MSKEEAKNLHTTIAGSLEERRQLVTEINTKEEQIRQRDQAIEDLEGQIEQQQEIITDQTRPEEEKEAAQRELETLQVRVAESQAQKDNLERELGLTTKEKIKRALMKYGVPLAFSAKANTISDLVPKALRERRIDDAEFSLILAEEVKYEQLKTSIRNKKTVIKDLTEETRKKIYQEAKEELQRKLTA
ncbi:spindle assembly abnormal protein 6-like [Actinia tenebrosa]|uniref:Spindle assembly abnormal protein 6-like n=1 Tax=Actinia tenebrosa TaxID=6105 RepID=A0A6P8H3Y7_ACTTE|nr:spindle assembly abnormal protein 6-like [Actinia tenebrosa]